MADKITKVMFAFREQTRGRCPTSSRCVPMMTEKPQTTTEVPEHDVLSLTGGGSLARLVHQGEVYLLRITRLGKLILTK